MAPIDVWIQRLIDEEFGGRDPFPSYGQQAGIVQQYLFYYKRSTRRSVAHKNKKLLTTLLLADIIIHVVRNDTPAMGD